MSNTQLPSVAVENAPPPLHTPPSRRSPPSFPLHLTIRFSSAIPDIDLDIPLPWAVRVAALKRQVRAQLPPADQNRSLRLIYQGRMLTDAALLGSAVKPPPPPRGGSISRTSTPDLIDDGANDRKMPGRISKGKDPEARQRIYILASLGPPLDTAGLATEDRLANTPPTPTHNDPDEAHSGADICDNTPAGLSSSRHLFSATGVAGMRSRGASPLARAPRGFDRLLDAGLSASEVNQLRLQFSSIQAARHTPDTMPSPDSLQRMEDAWIDSNATGPVAEAAAAGAGGETESGEDLSVEDSTDGLLRGLVLGFFWPLGCFSWALREEGMWSKRRHYSVWVGVILGVSIGTLRYLGSEGG
ncbi:hypothetical protein CFIMG_008200RA00001 [Ceratocystis fimbriata CBS 114723]|uniref:Ubiquitin-like domain-containing protein n=1 Tax=Ceratocystis fimbriata CBS 114723 TaxID=1035309 RepID=A0A2C5X6U5_9PEZI|nr:hypothetical protein CFIMG_008200RA00001 [Ceratocystis fimbriata CBS 114723]